MTEVNVSRNNNEVQGGTDRAFGVVFTIVFIVIGLWPLSLKSNVNLWALMVSLLLMIITLFKPSVLSPFNKIWTKFGVLLHKIISPFILGAIFYLAVVPTGIIMRLLGKDVLKLKMDANVSSYWEKRELSGPSPESMKRLY